MARLLITDDDPAILGLIRAILEPEGFEIAEAHNGIEAVEAVEHSDFDLLILDIMIPEMDGLEACRRIRQFSDMPIIFLSAKDEEADTVIGFALGADDYITKPFKPRELTARVRARLRRNTASLQTKRCSKQLISSSTCALTVRPCTHSTLTSRPKNSTF